MRTAFGVCFCALILAMRGLACDLCAIYRADDGRATEAPAGFTFGLAQQYVPHGRSQLDGNRVYPVNPDRLDTFITHVVPGYRFSARFGISLNLPLMHLSYRRTDLRYSRTAPATLVTEEGSSTGLGDASLIGRLTLFERRLDRGQWGVHLLAGVKLPTGNTSRLEDEVDQARIFASFLPPGTPHDPLGHSIAGVHPHSLSLGSGSVDGIVGLTGNVGWDRWLFNGQIQYYVRTPGESGFRYGNELMVSGGPGFKLLEGSTRTLTLQINSSYDTMARDHLMGQASDRTGFTAWYMGPLVSLVLVDRFNANVGVDLPVRISNNGFQSVPTYRLHGGISWRF